MDRYAQNFWSTYEAAAAKRIKGHTMTIGIAAICNNHRTIIFAADRLGISKRYLKQDAGCKIIAGSRFVMLGAGNADDNANIIDRIINKHNSLEDLGEECALEIRALLRKKKRNVFNKTGFDFDWFTDRMENAKFSLVKNILLGNLRATVFQPVLTEMAQVTANIHIIIGGISGNCAKIGYAEEPGIIEWCNRKRPFHAVGIAAERAAESLIIHKHSADDDVATALFNVYASKRESEATLGVGHETDMAILDIDNQGATFVNDDVVSVLSDEYERTHLATVDYKKIKTALEGAKT